MVVFAHKHWFQIECTLRVCQLLSELLSKAIRQTDPSIYCALQITCRLPTESVQQSKSSGDEWLSEH